MTGFMVSKKEELEEAVPSLTEIVIKVVPNSVATGVMDSVRLVPVPPNAMFATGTSVVLVDVAVKISEAGGVSASPITNAVVATLSSFVVRFGITEMVGRPFTAKTLLKPLVRPEALAVS